MSRNPRLLVLLSSLLLSAHAYSQAAPGSLPQDPRALMALAHEKNGLTGADIKPWHMHGVYHYQEDGMTGYQGTYDEWWFGPARYKLTFSSPSFTQSDYATGTALLREGEQDWLGGPELFLRSSLVDPLPAPSRA